MPNWCDNVLYIYKSDNVSPDLYKGLVEACDNNSLFQFLRPIPQDIVDKHKEDPQNDEWYYWCNQNWGTKWDAETPNVFQNDTRRIGISFSTAWGPPIILFEYVHQALGLEYELMFHEPGVELLGFSSPHGDDYYDFPSNWSSKSSVKEALRNIPDEIIIAFDLKESWREIYNDSR